MLSHDVLKSFKENFEFQTIDEFANHILTSEINVEKVHAELPTEYVKRIEEGYEQFEVMMDLLSQKARFMPLKHSGLMNSLHTQPWRRVGPQVYTGCNCVLGAEISLARSVVLEKATLCEGAHLFECLVLPGARVPAGKHSRTVFLAGDCTAPLCFPQRGEQPHPPLFETAAEEHREHWDMGDLLEEVRQVPVELRGSKGQEVNATLKSMGRPVVPLIALLVGLIQHKTMAEYQAWTDNWGAFLKELVSDEVAFIDRLVECGRANPAAYDGMHLLIQLLFKAEVVQAPAILDWACPDPLLAKRLAKFIEFLREDSGEDSDDL